MEGWHLWAILILILLIVFSLLYSRRRRVAAKPRVETPKGVEGVGVEIGAPVEVKAVTPIDLTEIKGIGAKRAEKLKAIGVNTVQDLARFSPEELSEKTDISKKLLSNWIEQARELIKQTG